MTHARCRGDTTQIAMAGLDRLAIELSDTFMKAGGSGHPSAAIYAAACEKAL
jgi:hypothetical protein